MNIANTDTTCFIETDINRFQLFRIRKTNKTKYTDDDYKRIIFGYYLTYAIKVLFTHFLRDETQYRVNAILFVIKEWKKPLHQLGNRVWKQKWNTSIF